MNLISTAIPIADRWGRVLAFVSFVLLVSACVAASSMSVEVAQSAKPAFFLAQDAKDSDSARWISIGDVTLVGGSELPNAQVAVAEQLKLRRYGSDVGSEAAERTRMLYQDNGYFKVSVPAPEVVQADASTVNVTIHIDAGLQYRLKDLQFSGNSVFSEMQLRSLYPIAPGDIFRTSAIRTGLEATRRLYISRGYIGVRLTPATVVDDAGGTILLTIAVGEPSPAPGSAHPDADQAFSGYYTVGGGVSAPRPLNTPDPQYDPISKAAGVQGSATYRVAIGSDGMVKDLRLTRGGDLPVSLLGNAEETLRQWTFDPAQRNGEPVPVQIRVEVNFKLY